MDFSISFTIMWGTVAENNERKFHKWNELKLSFLSRYKYFLSLYGSKKYGIQDIAKIYIYLVDFIH
jgi:hypothetical protein